MHIPLDQYIIYRLEPSKKRKGKLDKIPMHPQGYPHDPHDHSIWMSHDKAHQLSQVLGPSFGVGFVFTDKDPYWFLDIDGAMGDDGQWSELAITLCKKFSGCAVEVSVSEKGLHIVGSGVIPQHDCKNIELGLEFYHTGRFMALGKGFNGDFNFDATDVLNALIPHYFPLSNSSTSSEWTTEPAEGYTGPENDDELLAMAFHSSSKSDQGAMGGVTFQDLWDGNPSVLSEAYPDDERDYDASSADMALASHLAFWTGKNCERIKNLMFRSSLKRDKWVSHKSYIERTVTGAVGRCSNYVDKVREAPLTETIESARMRGDSGFCTGQDQIRRFDGCVYVVNQHRIMLPNGMMVKPEAFNAKFGGMSYVTNSEGNVTKKAFEVFTESQIVSFPKADKTSFRPDIPYQAITGSNGKSEVNTYLPFIPPKNNSPVDPFLQHMENLLPVQRDREIMYSWMSAVIRYKGKKILWAPLLQGCQGNGKSLITTVMRKILGDDYVHTPKASELDTKFNNWLRGKLLIAVEDVHVSHGRLEVMEALKPMITESRLEIQAKGQDQVTERVCANFLFNSNHKDALVKSRDDRRVAIFFTNQQSSDDLITQGMTAKYFTKLYNWIRGDGVGAIYNWLEKYQIPEEFDPMIGATRAPETSSTNEAISVSMGPIAQAIQEAVNEGRLGFCNGWLSSAMIRNLGLKCSPQKINQIVQDMGYKSPVSLMKNKGWTSHVTSTDKVKTKLFLTQGHPLISKDLGSSNIVKQYDEDQATSKLMS